MKKPIASLVFAVAVLATPALAVPLCSTILGTDVTSAGTQPGCDLSFTTHIFSFTDFQVLAVGGGPVLLTGTVVNNLTNTGTLIFNPQMSAGQHIRFSFGASDPLSVGAVGFTYTGSATQTSVREVVCSSAGVDLSTGVCTSGGALFDQTLNGAGGVPPTGISLQPGVRSWFDLTTQDGTIGALTASYQAAPEPWSVALMGTGLAALGLLKLRTRR